MPESPRSDTFFSEARTLNITFEGIPVTVTGRFKWTGVDQMNPSQLIQVLIDMKATALRRISLYETIDKYKSECNALDQAVVDNKDAPKAFIIALVLSVISFILAHLNTLFALIFGLFCFGSVCITIATFSGVLKLRKAKANYAKNYSIAEKNAQQAIQAFIQSECVEHADDFISGYAALPDYCNNDKALDFMIKALRNHRAATLGQAVNLYEEYREDLWRRGILEDQLAETRRAASAAGSAASAARSAAASADTAAYNTFRN